MISNLELLFDIHLIMRRNREKERRKTDLLIIDSFFIQINIFFVKKAIFQTWVFHLKK